MRLSRGIRKLFDINNPALFTAGKEIIMKSFGVIVEFRNRILFTLLNIFNNFHSPYLLQYSKIYVTHKKIMLIYSRKNS